MTYLNNTKTSILITSLCSAVFTLLTLCSHLTYAQNLNTNNPDLNAKIPAVIQTFAKQTLSYINANQKSAILENGKSLPDLNSLDLEKNPAATWYSYILVSGCAKNGTPHQFKFAKPTSNNMLAKYHSNEKIAQTAAKLSANACVSIEKGEYLVFAIGNMTNTLDVWLIANTLPKPVNIQKGSSDKIIKPMNSKDSTELLKSISDDIVKSGNFIDNILKEKIKKTQENTDALRRELKTIDDKKNNPGPYR